MDRATQERPLILPWICHSTWQFLHKDRVLRSGFPPRVSPPSVCFPLTLEAEGELFLLLTPHEPEPPPPMFPDTHSHSFINSDEKSPWGGEGGLLLRHVFKLPSRLC